MLVSVVVEAHGTGRMRALAEFRSDRRVSGRVGRTSTLDFARCASSRSNIFARVDPPGSVSPATVIASARPPVCAGKIHQRTPTFRHTDCSMTTCDEQFVPEGRFGSDRGWRRRGRSPVDLPLRSRNATTDAAMARGMQKQLSKDRAAAKKAGGPQQGKSQLGSARANSFKAPCAICKQPLVDYHQLKEHYEKKHPKEAVPPKE